MSVPKVMHLPIVRSALESVALFPLPGVVLFPGMVLPLHVFEPRYVRLVRDVLQDSALVSIPCIARGREAVPALPPVAGVGRVVHGEPLPGDRFQIVVLGLFRARLDELPFEPPYRRARVEVLDAHGEAAPRDVATLRQAAAALLADLRRSGLGEGVELPSASDPGALADALALRFVDDGAELQRVLEELDVGVRVARCTDALATALARRARGRGAVQ